MLATLSRAQFEEWFVSDQIDGTISGLDRLLWTVAGAAAIFARGQGVEAEPEDFVPGAERPEAAPQSPELQIEICRQIAAIQNSRL